MVKYLGFIDDTGVLEKDPNQRFFGLGLLKLEETAPFYQEVTTLKDRVVSFLPNLRKPFEFKFNKFNKNIQTNKIKKGIVDYLKKKLGVTSLAQNITIHKPNYFSVWLFDPKNNASYQRS